MKDTVVHTLNWVDYSIIGIIVLSTLISLMRGFIAEAISLATWIIAIFIAIEFAPHVGTLFTFIKSPSLRIVIGFIALFILILILGTIINHLISSLITKTGLSGTDRLLGSVFGVARGVLLVALLILLASFTSVPKDNWWSDSRLIPYFYNIADWLHHFLPEKMDHLSNYFPKTHPR